MTQRSLSLGFGCPVTLPSVSVSLSDLGRFKYLLIPKALSNHSYLWVNKSFHMHYCCLCEYFVEALLYNCFVIFLLRSVLLLTVRKKTQAQVGLCPIIRQYFYFVCLVGLYLQVLNTPRKLLDVLGKQKEASKMSPS